MKTAESTMMYNIPVVSELNRVPNFDPLKFLKKTENGVELPLKFKKLWFRLKYPQGRVRVSNIRITDQIAIIEARVFFDRKDTESVSNYTVSCDAKSAPNGQFLKYAQDLATEQALNDAGFGIQFVSADGEVAPTVAVKAAPAQEIKVEKKEPTPSVVTPTVEKTEVSQPVVEKAAPIVETPVVQSAVSDENDFEEIVADTPFDNPVAESVSTVTDSAPIAQEVPAEKAISEESRTDVAQTVPTQSVSAPSFTVTEKVEDVVDEKPAKASAPAYTKDMSVEDICAVMTLEEAENYVVPSGACAGQKMSQVAERRAASLRFYLNGYKGDDNILRAAAALIMAARPELKAS